jgi:sugar/nucleoside kinase (ribokinase family)
MAVLKQLTDPAIVIADSMDLWINTQREPLLELMGKIDLFVINDSEAKLFTETANLITAGHKLLAMGPKYVVIKKGEHGALLFGQGGQFFTSGAFPLHEVHDPTGAGDSFAGAIAGYLGSLNKRDITFADLSRAVVHGSVIASFNCEAFSIERLKELNQEIIDERFDELRRISAF